jgi:hypothetical protein
MVTLSAGLAKLVGIAQELRELSEWNGHIRGALVALAQRIERTTLDIGDTVEMYLEEAEGLLDDEDEDNDSVGNASPIDPRS